MASEGVSFLIKVLSEGGVVGGSEGVVLIDLSRTVPSGGVVTNRAFTGAASLPARKQAELRTRRKDMAVRSAKCRPELEN